MSYCKSLIVLMASVGLGSAGGIDELLSNASAVIEGSVVSAKVAASEISLQIRVSSTLLGKVSPTGTVDVTCNGLRDIQTGPRRR